ncbi:alpha-1,3-rhamnosyl/mannosyltransferase [Rhizobiales bacterium GAS191]|nr:alpha-1,3-rhamnosyl/mannosyltransferase [Rhizobiales bacterium GAS113]SEC04978.1 alpha-1,3-rhamnosyl/mannosyltransferase [Rhizobiales bacterium GAS191]
MDILFGAEALLGPLTGIGNYAAALLRGLRADQRIGTVRCFADRVWLADPLTQGAQPRAMPFSRLRRLALAATLRLAPRIPGAAALLPRKRKRDFVTMLSKAGASVYHEPNFILRPFDGPSVATIHDLSILRHPEFHPADRVEYMTRNFAETIERATRLITVSESVRAEMIATLDVAPDRVVAIHNGVGPQYHPMTPAELGPTLAPYDLEAARYLLFVGTIEPRKNLGLLLDAYEAQPPALRRRFPLVVVGGQGWRNEALVDRLAALAARGIVRSLGYVPAEHLPALYAGARGFVFPSLYEGFGLPVLEAAASGVPVLSSRGTAMAEVLGETGLLVEPQDVAALRDGLLRLLEDDALATVASTAAPGFAARFSWTHCVERTIELYQGVA